MGVFGGWRWCGCRSLWRLDKVRLCFGYLVCLCCSYLHDCFWFLDVLPGCRLSLLLLLVLHSRRCSLPLVLPCRIFLSLLIAGVFTLARVSASPLVFVPNDAHLTVHHILSEATSTGNQHRAASVPALFQFLDQPAVEGSAPTTSAIVDHQSAATSQQR